MGSEIHIGKLIKTAMKEQGRKASWLAEQLHCDRTNIYKIFRKQSIDTELLTTVSKTLKVDFFAHYSKALSKIL